jgi:hypothetical protein
MKILQSEITWTQTSFSTNFGGKMSFILSLIFPERFHRCYIYIFTAVTCTATIVTLEPFPFFSISLWRFNKISLLCRYVPLKEGTVVKAGPNWKFVYLKQVEPDSIFEPHN